MRCKVLVDYSLATEPTEAETLPLAEAQADAAPAGTEGTDKTETAQTEETAAPTEKSKLKLKKTDIRLGVYYEFELLLDCDLEQNEVQWSSEHPYIASVDENGVVKAIKAGTTAITATYGDQKVQCIVRCS